MKKEIEKEIESSNKSSQDNLENSYLEIMQGFKPNILFQQTWEKDGDNFKKFSLYDNSHNCVSGTLAF
ncbi:MAG: hypothetical protein M0P32_03165 [Bacteroidales bacterium]|nr:hypothetical protein [Bacteroidales bacterium]MDD2576962.1 hypothetical protein [Bacteroidales bacterium]